MGKIITPDEFKGRIAGNTDRQKFSIELKDGNIIDVIFDGKPELLIQMLFDTMQAHPHIAHTIITGVLIFADQKKIALENLKDHSFLNHAL
jgi:hypothetical protein